MFYFHTFCRFISFMWILCFLFRDDNIIRFLPPNFPIWLHIHPVIMVFSFEIVYLFLFCFVLVYVCVFTPVPVHVHVSVYMCVCLSVCQSVFHILFLFNFWHVSDLSAYFLNKDKNNTFEIVWWGDREEMRKKKLGSAYST